MEQVTNQVSETAQNTVNVATGAKNDIIQLQFYKNPVFIVSAIYMITVFGIYFNMNEGTKNTYIFSNKFRDSAGDIHWLDIITYPYSLGLKSIFYSPIMLYLFLGIYLIVNIIDPLQTSNQSYFYSVMFSFLVILVLFVIHMIIFHYIINPENVKVELTLGDPDKIKKTYEDFYRTQWLLLIVFSPIIITTVVYAIRKMDKSSK
jgi:amino acid transporter